MTGSFHWIDWAILIAYVFGTSWLAERLAGKGQTIRDFFLGGRSLPWWAVCGSIVAGEVSGVTFVSIPAIAWAEKGDFTYLQIWMGYMLARVGIGLFLIPAYYRREIYSPYEFMGQQLGPLVNRMGAVLFLVGALLAQGARLFLAALVLDAITDLGIIPAILLMAAISVVWTWLGGMTSVIWTDVVQFVLLVVGGIAGLVAVAWAVPGGFGAILDAGREAGKFRLWDFSTDPGKEFTFWCGLIGSAFFTFASHGTDQNMAQRLFCCRSEGEARKAIIGSCIAVLLPVLMLFVGAGLWVYFRHFPMTPEELAKVTPPTGRSDYVFPVFILRAMPVGVKGLLFAAIFSAATMTSTLAAMAQTGLASFWLPLQRGPVDEKRQVFISRIFVLLSAAGLSAVAIAYIEFRQYPDLLRLALAMAGYTYGALLGMLLLALLPFGRDDRGLMWGVPYAMLAVLALNWQHVEWVRWAIAGSVGALAAWGVVRLVREPARIGWVLAGAAVVLGIAFLRPMTGADGAPAFLKLAFPWHVPIGAAITLAMGVALGRRRPGGEGTQPEKH